MKPIHFELPTYIIFVTICVLIATIFHNRRDYWYAFIGCSLMFPFEWIADRYWMFLDYDWGFVMFPILFERLPLMMPFAWGWFFGFPIIICMLFEKKIDVMPLVLRIVVLWAVFWGWDFWNEYVSTKSQLWDYHWSKEHMIGGILPWFIPFAVSFGNVLLYFAHKIALKKSRDQTWIQGFCTHFLAYLAVFLIQVCVGWPIVKLWGVAPVYAP